MLWSQIIYGHRMVSISPKTIWFYITWWLSESASVFLILTTCFFEGMMANFVINVYIIARENLFHPCKMISYNAGWAPYYMWPCKRKFFKIVRCPGNYQIRWWCANRWNHTMSVLFVTIALVKMYITKFINFISLIEFKNKHIAPQLGISALPSACSNK